jgi:hypothetical protein
VPVIVNCSASLWGVLAVSVVCAVKACEILASNCRACWDFFYREITIRCGTLVGGLGGFFVCLVG